MRYRKELFKIKNVFDTAGTEQQFFNAVKENCIYQYNHCSQYKLILDKMGFSTYSLHCYDDIVKIPFLPTLFFKNHTVFSMPSKFIIKATSSGTKGKFSNIGLELSGLLCALKMVIKIGYWRRLFSFMPINYVVFGYKPHKGNKTGVTKTAFGATLYAPAIRRTYTLKYRNGGYAPDFEGTIDAIIRYSRSKFPTRFMGFPSYTYFVMKMMEERGLCVKLKEGSKIMLGGGWKQFYSEQVDKGAFYALAEKTLGVKEENIIEFFGAVEHPVLYCDCKNHHFHVPIYSRVIIRDVTTLEPVENGKVGLVNLITPMIKATPILSVMTDDLGILHDGSECGCGISSPYLEIVGRVGLKDIKTCAAGAAELISGVKL